MILYVFLFDCYFYCLISTYPFSVAIMKDSPVTTVVTKGHKVGGHEILTKK